MTAFALGFLTASMFAWIVGREWKASIKKKIMVAITTMPAGMGKKKIEEVLS